MGMYLLAEELCCQGLRELRLADAARPDKEEHTYQHQTKPLSLHLVLKQLHIHGQKRMRGAGTRQALCIAVDGVGKEANLQYSYYHIYLEREPQRSSAGRRRLPRLSTTSTPVLRS